MYDYSCNSMKCSASNGVSGARPHIVIARATPVNNKILMFLLWIQLMKCYIINSTGRLAMNILYVNVHSVINELCN
jgi:hypothetical protein